jgi:hypothetical protein
MVRRHRRLVWLGIVAAVVLDLAGCGGPPVAAPAPKLPSPPTLAKNRLGVQIDLSATQVMAGHPLQAVVLVYNPDAPINLNQSVGAGGCSPAFEVILTNGTVRNTVAFTTACGTRPFIIQHGSNRFPQTVSTVFNMCITNVPNNGPPTPNQPLCLPSGKQPPLPKGSYRAVMRWSLAVPPLPPPAPVTVHLT